MVYILRTRNLQQFFKVVASSYKILISCCMTKMNKILKFLKKQDMLEKFNKDTGQWETVKMDLSDPKIYEVMQIMTAELEILVRIEEMELGIYEPKGYN